jgi:transcription elongation factor GreA
MSDKTVYMTKRGLVKVQAQFERLRDIEGPALAVLLHDAQDGADPADNTEYLMLRDELAFMNRRIRTLEDILRSARLIEHAERDGKVHLGNTVIVQTNGDVPETYTLVGSAEAFPDEGFISNESPLGQALLDQAIGNDVTVMTPDGELHFRILAVT